MAITTYHEDLAKAVLAHRECATESEDPQKGGKLTIFCQVVNYPLATYATQDVIAEAETE